jgi:hypothetical protein
MSPSTPIQRSFELQEKHPAQKDERTLQTRNFFIFFFFVGDNSGLPGSGSANLFEFGDHNGLNKDRMKK